MEIKNVDMILSSEDISSVSFVGSTNVAKYIYKTAAANGKRVQALAELKPSVVMPDANINQAVDGIIGAARSAGKDVAVSVVVAVGNIADQLEIKYMKTLKSSMLLRGLIESLKWVYNFKNSKEKIEEYIKSGVEEGARQIRWK